MAGPGIPVTIPNVMLSEHREQRTTKDGKALERPRWWSKLGYEGGAIEVRFPEHLCPQLQAGMRLAVQGRLLLAFGHTLLEVDHASAATTAAGEVPPVGRRGGV